MTTEKMIVLVLIGIFLLFLLYSQFYFLPSLVKRMGEKRNGFILPEENRIYFVLKGKAFHKAILVSKNYFLTLDWIVKKIQPKSIFKNPHFTKWRKYFMVNFNAWWYGLPWIYKIDTFNIDFIQLETTETKEVIIEKAKKVTYKTDHLRLFYQYLVITPDVRTGGKPGEENDDKSELINLTTYSLYRIRIIDAYKARYEFSNHVEYLRTEINGAIRDMMGDMTIDVLNEKDLNDFESDENPFKKMVTSVNKRLRDRAGIEIMDAIFLRFEPADEIAKKTFEAAQKIYIAEQEALAKQATAEGDQKFYRIKLGHDLSQTYTGNAEAAFFESFKDMPMYGRIQVIKALPPELLSLGSGMINFIMGNNNNNKQQKNN